MDANYANKMLICEICDYKCSRKADYERHLLTKKHLKNASKKACKTRKTRKFVEFSCKFCGVTYKHRPSLSRHLKKCKSVEFILSLDGYGELNERVRKNCEWNKIERFIDQVKLWGYKLSVNTVLHRNNYHGLVDLENYINSLKDVEWSVNILTFPKQLNVNTVENKQEVISSIAKTNIANKEALINHVARY